MKTRLPHFLLLLLLAMGISSCTIQESTDYRITVHNLMYADLRVAGQDLPFQEFDVLEISFNDKVLTDITIGEESASIPLSEGVAYTISLSYSAYLYNLETGEWEHNYDGFKELGVEIWGAGECLDQVLELRIGDLFTGYAPEYEIFCE